VIYPIV